MLTDERVAVIGLGYVGLPVALAAARHFPNTIGFDTDSDKVAELRSGCDRTGEVDRDDLLGSSITLTADVEDLRGVTFFIVAVPTPIDGNRRPDLRPLRQASELIGRVLERGAVVVFESTVYPGVTEEICAPVLEAVSRLVAGGDFKLGYSPERINPGDKQHTLERIVKVVAGQDEKTLERVARLYERLVPAGVHRASSIKVAEAAKVIENTQRDLNISLMNELAIIFDRLGVSTREVLEAAGTKWNFLPFRPGLVGGHCIGVDPYYLTSKAEEVGYHPQVILAGRRINDGMGTFIAQKVVKLLAKNGVVLRAARVGILGVTFKENVPDIRNSRVPDIAHELQDYGVQALVHDPLVDGATLQREYGLSVLPWSDLTDLDALVLAVAHRDLVERPISDLLSGLKPNGVLIDVKSALSAAVIPPGIEYWSL